jgi:hypothetical protein
MAPTAIAAIGVTKPAAGVMATSPTTAAMAAPVADGRPERIMSMPTHVTTAAAAASIVVTKARTATPSAASAEPALKPNHPNQSSDAPRMTNGTLCGRVSPCGLRPASVRGPRMTAATRADTPALTCTTVPPAKSRAPSSPIQPPGPHTQCASGQ